MDYNFIEIEKKWQQWWAQNKTYRASADSDKPKYYVLDMFPYPSGAGLHVGHPLGYIASDIYARYKRLKGFNVLHPMGYDAFGLPAEQYAIQTGQHPEKTTHDNVARYREQLDRIGFSFDWDREFRTSDPDYYKWTQWAFLRMFGSWYDNKLQKARPIEDLVKAFEEGGSAAVEAACSEGEPFTAAQWKAFSKKEKADVLMRYRIAYQGESTVNWCPALGTVLANDEVKDGYSERGGHPVFQKKMTQWQLRVSAYAGRLLDGLDRLDWTESLKEMQRNWIGRSEGAEMVFKVQCDGQEHDVTIFTTRADTIFGVTFMVLAPESEWVPVLTSASQKNEVEAYLEQVKKKTERERIAGKAVTGVFSGAYGINPLTGEKVPVWISEYVLAGYGTGAIMAVPAHDERDYDFAKKFGIDIIEVIKGGDISKEAYTGDGEMVNSEFLNGIKTKKEAIAKMLEYLSEKGIGEKGVQYKMKDWAFNRQRYWGEPIPIIHCPKCGMVGVPYEELPLKLPPVENFEPGEGGESPLAKIDSFVNCSCPRCGGPAKRETDTMPQWAGSSWYFLRYTDPHNPDAIASKEALDYWMPVDWYNGGMEHVTRHMIYSRFWHRFLYDIGVVPCEEPYAKRTAQGLILGPDGDKMSKSKGNVVDPNDVVDVYGADVLRVYVLFMGDYGSAAPWSDSSVKGCKRFLDRVAALPDMVSGTVNPKLETLFHKTVKKVTGDIDDMKFNTAIAALMTLLNDISDAGSLTKDQLVTFIKLLNPFAPHLTEEIWENLGGEGFLSLSSWPVWDEAKTVDDEIEIAVQIGGKLKGTILIPKDAAKEDAIAAAKADPKIAPQIEGKTVVKEIYVPGKIVNIVVK